MNGKREPTAQTGELQNPKHPIQKNITFFKKEKNVSRRNCCAYIWHWSLQVSPKKEKIAAGGREANPPSCLSQHQTNRVLSWIGKAPWGFPAFSLYSPAQEDTQSCGAWMTPHHVEVVTSLPIRRYGDNTNSWWSRESPATQGRPAPPVMPTNPQWERGASLLTVIAYPRSVHQRWAGASGDLTSDSESCRTTAHNKCSMTGTEPAKGWQRPKETLQPKARTQSSMWIGCKQVSK